MRRTTFVCFKWQAQKYRHLFTATHVNEWAKGLHRALCGEKHRMICVTDDPADVAIETFPLWSDHSTLFNPSGKHLPSCYRRLKLFWGEQTRAMGIPDGEPVVWIDLDVLFVRDVRPMFSRDEPVIGWRGEGAHNPEVYNGTIIQFRAGDVEYLWKDFAPQHTPRMCSEKRYFGSDQAWLSFRLAGRETAHWTTRDGMYSFSRDIRPARNNYMPPQARIISFNGPNKPWDPHMMERYPWINKYWRPTDEHDRKVFTADVRPSRTRGRRTQRSAHDGGRVSNRQSARGEDWNSDIHGQGGGEA